LTINLKAEQKSRLMNTECFDFIDKYLELSRVSRKENRKNISSLELGCGSGPLGAHMLEQGYSVDFSDFSTNCVKRLKEEFGYNAFVADCRQIKFAADNTYDVILLEGTVYESNDYDNPLKIYREINRILKLGGIFIHFLNTYLNPARRVLHSYLAQNIAWYFNPTRVLGRNKFVRKLFGKNPAKKRILYWLYHPEEITNILLESNFLLLDKPQTCRVEYGVSTLPFFIGKGVLSFAKRKRTLQDEYEFSDVAYSRRDEVLSAPAILLSNIARKYFPKTFSGSIGYCVKKKTLGEF